MKLYLAGRYSRRGELAGYATQAELLGHEVTSRWLRDDEADESVASREARAGWANRDLMDIESADVLVLFAEDGPQRGGGRHIEFGYAAALRKRLFVVMPSSGMSENIFIDLIEVLRFQSWDQLYGVLDVLPILRAVGVSR